MILSLFLQESVDYRVLELEPDLLDVKASSRYTTELLSLACAPALLSLSLYPDAKELTESFAAFNAARQYLKGIFGMDDPSVIWG